MFYYLSPSIRLKKKKNRPSQPSTKNQSDIYQTVALSTTTTLTLPQFLCRDLRFRTREKHRRSSPYASQSSLIHLHLRHMSDNQTPSISTIYVYVVLLLRTRPLLGMYHFVCLFFFFQSEPLEKLAIVLLSFIHIHILCLFLVH